MNNRPEAWLLRGVMLWLLVSVTHVSGAQVCNDGLACEFESSGRGGVEFDIGAGIVPILTGFELAYSAGDQHVHTMAVGILPDRPSRFQLRLRDNDGNEVVRGRARYFRYEQVLRAMRERTGTRADSPVMTLRSVTRRGCRGSCLVDIPGFDKSRYHFYLSGFRFSFRGDDRHLRTVRVWPVGEIAGTSSVWTTFRDNSEDRSYDVTLSYVLLPADHAIESVLYGGTVSPTDESGTVHFPRRNASGRALGGFGAVFAGDDEHLRVIGVWLSRAGGEVTLRDNDAREDITPYIVGRRLPVE